MNRVGGRADERGLIGKLAIFWLLLLALFVVAAFDVGSIAITRYKVSSAAQDASFQAASVFKGTGDRTQAYQAALRQVEQEAPGAHIPKNGFSINTQTGEVTVTVIKRASTLIAGRLGFLKEFTKASATETAKPPTL